MLRSGNMEILPYPGHPSKELTADHHRYTHPEPIFSYRHDYRLCPKPVQNHSDNIIAAFQRHFLVMPAIHREGLLREFRKIKILEFLLPDSFLIRHTSLLHLIHPVMFHTVRVRVISNQIIIRIIPGQ